MGVMEGKSPREKSEISRGDFFNERIFVSIRRRIRDTVCDTLGNKGIVENPPI